MTRLLWYGLLGWCVEVAWTGASSMLDGNWKLTATTYLWMFPIYGMSAFLLEGLHERIRALPIALRGGIWMSIIFACEFVFGYLFLMFLEGCPWDYSAAPLHVYGLIRLDYAPAWFVLGLLYERVHDHLAAVYK